MCAKIQYFCCWKYSKSLRLRLMKCCFLVVWFWCPFCKIYAVFSVCLCFLGIYNLCVTQLQKGALTLCMLECHRWSDGIFHISDCVQIKFLFLQGQSIQKYPMFLFLGRGATSINGSVCSAVRLSGCPAVRVDWNHNCDWLSNDQWEIKQIIE